MKDDDVYKLIRQIRENWQNANYDFDRCIRVLGLALVRCSDNVTSVVEATIDEASRRQLYQVLRK